MVGPVILKGIDSQHIGGLFYCNGPDTKRGIALAPEDEATGIRLLLEQGGSIVGKCDNDTDINYQILTREDKIQGIPTNSN
jgi:hypothetical protein